MKTHKINTLVNATPMTRGEYNDLRGWPRVAGENQTEEGFMVEWMAAGSRTTINNATNLSWMAAATFNSLARPVDVQFGFDTTSQLLAQSLKVRRASWSEGVHVVVATLPTGRASESGKHFLKIKGTVSAPWIPLADDVLASDWVRY